MTISMTRAATGAGTLALALTLAMTAACSNQDDADRQGAPAGEQSTSTPPDPSPPASTTTPLVAAGKLVLGKASGTTLTSIEVDGGGYEVTVADDDGSATEATTNANGTDLTRDPHDSDDNDADDKAERKREVAAASVDFEDAAAAVVKAVPGTIRELNLDTQDGSNQVVWEADVRADSGGQMTVVINAANGSVVSTTADD